jgi:hypothetical protein
MAAYKIRGAGVGAVEKPVRPVITDPFKVDFV